MSIEAAFFGKLTRDAESKLSATGKPYLRIVGVRIGEGDKAQWVTVTSFDQDAIASAGKFVRGTHAYVEGRLTLDKWKAGDGSDRSGLACMSWHCRLAQIDRNKPRRDKSKPPDNQKPSALADAAPFDDPLPRWAP